MESHSLIINNDKIKKPIKIIKNKVKIIFILYSFQKTNNVENINKEDSNSKNSPKNFESSFLQHKYISSKLSKNENNSDHSKKIYHIVLNNSNLSSKNSSKNQSHLLTPRELKLNNENKDIKKLFNE